MRLFNMAASVHGGEHLPESPLLHGSKLLGSKRGTCMRFGRWKWSGDISEDWGKQTNW